MPLYKNVLYNIVGFIGLTLSSASVQADSHVVRPASQRESAKQWTPDATIQNRMDTIRGTVVAVKAEISESRLDPAGYRRLATSLEEPTKALLNYQSASDGSGKAFHTIVLGDLRWGIEMMQMSPKVDVQRLGALSVIQALKNYGLFFTHPGWVVVP